MNVEFCGGGDLYIYLHLFWHNWLLVLDQETNAMGFPAFALTKAKVG